MDIILIPGLWLDGSSWDQVVPILEQAGHRAHALTLPGMTSKAADRSGITLRDHLAAVVEAIDSVQPAGATMCAIDTAASPLLTRPTYSSMILPPGTGMRVGAAMSSAIRPVAPG